jgi:hypothetical protein
MFIKELGIYVDYLKNRLVPLLNPANPKEKKALDNFHNNIKEGILYYKELFSGKLTQLQGKIEDVLKELDQKEAELG